MAMPLFVMMMTIVLNRHTFANSYVGAKTDLPWPCPSLCLLTTDDPCFFPLLASTCFVCLSVCLIVKSYLEIEWSLLTLDDESLQKLNSCHSLEVDISRRPLSLSPSLGNISIIILLGRNMSRNMTCLAYFLRI